MNRFIDIHAHILPGVDDGPSTLEESVEMARIAAGDNIVTMVDNQWLILVYKTAWFTAYDSMIRYRI